MFTNLETANGASLDPLVWALRPILRWNKFTNWIPSNRASIRILLMEKGIKELPTMEILQFFLIPYMPTIKSALVCMLELLESVCLSHCWTKCDCLLSMDGNFLIATHCQMLIALDANEFLAATKDAWSLSLPDLNLDMADGVVIRLKLNWIIFGKIQILNWII